MLKACVCVLSRVLPPCCCLACTQASSAACMGAARLQVAGPSSAPCLSMLLVLANNLGFPHTICSGAMQLRRPYYSRSTYVSTTTGFSCTPAGHERAASGARGPTRAAAAQVVHRRPLSSSSQGPSTCGVALCQAAAGCSRAAAAAWPGRLCSCSRHVRCGTAPAMCVF